MRIEQELFSSYRPLRERLLEYGFEDFSGVLTYAKDFMDGEFRALITIDEKGLLAGKVIEKEFGEEYTQLRIASLHGGFVGSVRESYKAILLDIREKCFKREAFLSNQANRLNDLIKERFSESPDFPFDEEKYRNYGVYRYAGNDKWYGLVMNVSRSVFKGEKEGNVDVINVRIDEERREETLKTKGIYPSYHMNKQKWVSILLDETLSDEEIFSFVSWSRDFMKGKGERKKKGPLHFLQPCNPKYYDLEKAFIRDKGITGWKQSRNVEIGDICYMYIAKPLGAVKYKCEVVEKDIPYEYRGENLRIDKLMKIKLIKRIDEGLPFSFLKSLGVTLIRGPVTLSEEQAKKIEEAIA